MGEAVAPKGEYILFLLPFEKDEQMSRLIDGLQKKHHNIEYEYHAIAPNAGSYSKHLLGLHKPDVSDGI